MDTYLGLLLSILSFLSDLLSPVADKMYRDWINTEEATSLLEEYNDTIQAALTQLDYVLNYSTLEELAEALQSAYIN